MAQINYKLERLFTTREDEMLWLVLLKADEVTGGQGVEELADIMRNKIIEKYGTDEFTIMSYFGSGSFFEVKIKTSKYNSQIFFSKCPQWTN